MKGCRLIGMLAVGVLLCSCAGHQPATPASEQPEQTQAGVSRLEGVSFETVQKEPKLAVAAYENVVVNPVQMSHQLVADYPEAGQQLQAGLIAQLKTKKGYKHVGTSEANGRQPQGRTMIVDVKIVDMRIVSTNARIWGGVMAGSSYMDLSLKLTDASTRRVIHEKILTTHNNAFAASWAVEAEKSLPTDMGKIIGEYLYTVLPPSSAKPAGAAVKSKRSGSRTKP